jgi:uncharacterized protein YgbK (DUF1537 family)
MPEILVIADDFTGAAEIGGIAHLFGLSVRIMMDVCDLSRYKEDVIVLDTNSRRLRPESASGRILTILADVDLSNIKLIYKKVDSVLRGPVESEIKAVMKAARIQTAVLIPANPSKGRTIKNGRYYINEIPINETDFINDPEYPRTSNDVREMIIDGTGSLWAGIPAKANMIKNISIRDIGAEEDFRNIIKELSEVQYLPAGGADFFRSLLQEKLKLPESGKYTYTRKGGKRHFLIGSKSQQSQHTISILSQSHWQYLPLPDHGLIDKNIFSEWLDQINHALGKGHEIIVARPENQIDDQQSIKKIIYLLAKAFDALIEYCSPNDEVLIEGGETASTIIKNMENADLRIKEVIADGVVKLELDHSGVFLIVKPGSYSWSELIINSLRFDQ